MTTAVNRSVKNPEIPIPAAVIEAMPKVAGTILLKGKPREQLNAGKLLLAFMEYNKAANAEPVQKSGQTINVGVQIDNGSEQRRNRTLAIAQRFGAVGILRDASAGAGASDRRADCSILDQPDTDEQ